MITAAAIATAAAGSTGAMVALMVKRRKSESATASGRSSAKYSERPKQTKEN
jgi:hypothetical protein